MPLNEMWRMAKQRRVRWLFLAMLSGACLLQETLKTMASDLGHEIFNGCVVALRSVSTSRAPEPLSSESPGQLELVFPPDDIIPIRRGEPVEIHGVVSEAPPGSVVDAELVDLAGVVRDRATAHVGEADAFNMKVATTEFGRGPGPSELRLILVVNGKPQTRITRSVKQID
jgi:hypothetical protein